MQSPFCVKQEPESNADKAAEKTLNRPDVPTAIFSLLQLTLAKLGWPTRTYSMDSLPPRKKVLLVIVSRLSKHISLERANPFSQETFQQQPLTSHHCPDSLDKLQKSPERKGSPCPSYEMAARPDWTWLGSQT